MTENQSEQAPPPESQADRPGQSGVVTPVAGPGQAEGRLGDHVDVGIITIISSEIESMRLSLGVRNYAERQYREGDVFWRTTVPSAVRPERQVRVVLYVQGQAGNHPTAALASKVIQRHRPRILLLAGIAAGLRERIKIGDVVSSLAIADHSMGVSLPEGRTAPRPLIERRQHVISQMCAAAAVPTKEWHELLTRVYDKPAPTPQESRVADTTRFARLARVASCLLGILPAGRFGRALAAAGHAAASEFVAKKVRDEIGDPPTHREAVISSNNRLLRDGATLEAQREGFHQQTLVGEMEAAGLISACDGISPPIPWLVVRGVSDFGDPAKADDYHLYASCTASSYLALWLKYVLDLDLLDSGRGGGGDAHPPPPPAPPTASVPSLSLLPLPVQSAYITVDGRDVGVSPGGPIWNFPVRSVRVRALCGDDGPNATDCIVRIRFGEQEVSLWQDGPVTIYRGDRRDIEIARVGGTENRIAVFAGEQRFWVTSDGAESPLRFDISIRSENGGSASLEVDLPLEPTLLLDRASLRPSRVSAEQITLLRDLFAGLDRFRSATLSAVTNGDRESLREARALGDALSAQFTQARVMLPLQVDPQRFLDVFNGLYQCLIDAVADTHRGPEREPGRPFQRYKGEVLPLYEALTREWQEVIARGSVEDSSPSP